MAGEHALGAVTVIALSDDARKVGRGGVEREDWPGSRGIPEKEDRTAGEHKPVSGFAAAGLDNEVVEKVGVAADALLFVGCAAEPGGTVGKEVLPSADV